MLINSKEDCWSMRISNVCVCVCVCVDIMGALESGEDLRHTRNI
jgi:hypothetical protein